MNMKQIVKQWLKDNGYEGLYPDIHFEECGCGFDDFMPCNSPNEDCLAATKSGKTRDGCELFEPGKND